VAVGGGRCGGSLRWYMCQNAVMLKKFESALDLPYNRVRTLVWVGLVWFGFMVVSASFSNISLISWRSVLLVDETGIPEKTTELLEHKHFQINLHVFNHLNS